MFDIKFLKKIIPADVGVQSVTDKATFFLTIVLNIALLSDHVQVDVRRHGPWAWTVPIIF